MKTTFEIVCWPDIQALMELDGFNENAYLINDEKGLEEYGSSAYFVNSDWLRKNTLKNRPFNIPDFKDLEHQVTEYVKKHQGDNGFIRTADRPDCIIFALAYNEPLAQLEDCYVSAIRVNEKGKLQISFFLTPAIVTPELADKLNDYNWVNIDDDIIYYEQTLFNIIDNLPNHENL